MSAARLVMRAILAASVIVGLEMWMDAQRVERASYQVDGRTTTISDDRGNEGPAVRRHDYVIDRYGNPIEEAVGDYRVDPRGAIFERHSPATEVLRLPDPSA